ncbi:DUF1758 domain-containing protein [Trichonephila inaurata madagascariensis]|uniref:DUF1758 domain-containing protein n=1 Tax=Trichonephila inaurata madagascariensis TaxID=2747483 RepID=A0A8X6J2N6_9ARAC|nr:DUF1758 domain-containing protein [Trichonephila inaurata madagascariensis]
MDALKIKRKSLRTSFTATENMLKEYLATKEDGKDGDNLSALNSQLQDKFLRLDEVQNKISDLLLENTATAPITSENYPKAVEHLKLRFGREDLLVQIYVRNLLSLVLKTATTAKNAPDLATLYDMLKTKLRALESLGCPKEKFADFFDPLWSHVCQKMFCELGKGEEFQKLLMMLQVRDPWKSLYVLFTP